MTNTFEIAKKKVGTERANKFCYITTAQIEDYAKEKMLERKKEKSELLDHFYDGDALIKLLNEYNLKNEIDVIEHFYFK